MLARVRYSRSKKKVKEVMLGDISKFTIFNRYNAVSIFIDIEKIEKKYR